MNWAYLQHAGPGVTTVLGWNRENGGRRADGTYDLDTLAKVVLPVAPDVFCYQEAWGYDANGGEILHAAENALGMRGFLTRSDRGPLHEIVFVGPDIHVSHHWKRQDHDRVFGDQVGFVQMHIPGFPAAVQVRSVQLAHWNGDQRLDLVRRWRGHAAPDRLSMLVGDFNGFSADRNGNVEFKPDWERVDRHARSDKTLPPDPSVPEHEWVTDTRATDALHHAGFVDVGAWAGDMTVTVNEHIDHGQGGRIDLAVLGPRLAKALVRRSYRVLTGPNIDAAGDHRPFVFRLDPRLLVGGPR